MGCRLSAIWPCAPQGLRHSRPPRSPAPARSFSSSSLLFRARPRCQLLGRRSHANTTTSFLMRHIKSPSDIPEVCLMLRKRDTRRAVILLSLCCAVFCTWILAPQVVVISSHAEAQALLAPTPPMGWNSWDSYGETVSESDIKANAAWMAKHLKSYGWQYIVVDSGWYVPNPSAGTNAAAAEFSLDAYGRYTPAVNTIPSAANGAGFKPLADYVHSLGLKFGIHILRGIPKEAVEKNLAIDGSSYHAADGANRTDLCPWNPDNYGTDPSKPAAQEYYDSIARLYASWGVDLIKADCISSRPYKGDDIRMLSMALRKTGRPLVLSLSPGAAPIEKIDEMGTYAQMWRISDDVWDLWHSTVDYPQGLGDQFPRIAKWASRSEPGHWPDADMLPLGYLGPAPGWGKARQTRLSHDEHRTFLTLWSRFGSPLMTS